MDNNNTIEKLLLDAQEQLDEHNALYSDLLNDREKIIKFYTKRINKVQKRIRTIGNSIKREKSRIIECKKILGIPVQPDNTIEKPEKIISNSVSPEKYAINPVTGEVVELSYSEMAQLLSNTE